MLMFPRHLLLSHVKPTSIHGPNMLDSYAILSFKASAFTFTTRHIHSWVSFPVWPSLFILSGSISSHPSHFFSSMLEKHDKNPLGFICQCHIFLPFHTVCEVLEERILEWFAIPFSNGPLFVNSDYPSWVALQGIVYSFIKLYKPLHHNKAVIHEGNIWSRLSWNLLTHDLGFSV